MLGTATLCGQNSRTVMLVTSPVSSFGSLIISEIMTMYYEIAIQLVKLIPESGVS